MFGIQCDNCGEMYDGGYSGFAYFPDPGTTMEYASDQGWHQKNEPGDIPAIHYCPACVSFDDDDKMIINTERTKTRK